MLILMIVQQMFFIGPFVQPLVVTSIDSLTLPFKIAVSL